jgi:hypothetical protein
MKRAVFGLVVLVSVMSLAAPASAALRWSQNGQPLERGQQIRLRGNFAGIELHFLGGEIVCTSGTTTGTIVVRAIKDLQRTVGGCTFEVPSPGPIPPEINDANSCQSGSTTGRITTVGLKAKLGLLEDGHVGIRTKKRLLARFTCVYEGVTTDYKLRGSLLEDLGVPSNVEVSGLISSLACQDLVLIQRTKGEPKRTTDVTMIQRSNVPLEEPTISPEQFAATGSGESFAAACPRVVPD